jgi:hypothetical protein
MITCVCKNNLAVMGVISFILLILTIDLIHYAFYISPHYFITQPIKPRLTSQFSGATAYGIAYLLSLLRLPFAVAPYLTKLLSFLVLQTRFQLYWNSYTFQLIRTTGDFANLIVTLALLEIIFDCLNAEWDDSWLCLSMSAEVIRLVSEKGQMLFSAMWQLIPHRLIVQRITSPIKSQATENWLVKLSLRYHNYYILSEEDRIQYILRAVKAPALFDMEAIQKLEYVQSLCIIPQNVGLRAGMVRDVAQGKVFIHAKWTNDPWLLAGLVMRRSPWIFDPRYLRRPFYYRTEANRLATLFVLQYASYNLPYTWYQFGHEIKVARYDLFYRICRWLSFNLEETVREDGTFMFDSFIHWLGLRLGYESARHGQRSLWTDEEVITDILANLNSDEIPSASEVATRYTYPLKYIQEVLLPEILNRKANLKKY